MTKLLETGIELTAKQIRDLDEINADKNSINATLGVAMQYHSNRMNEVCKKETEWWLEIAELNDLDLDAGKYQTSQKGPIARVMKIQD